MASSKGKVSKNSKKGSKSSNFVPEKRIKPKKPILYIELIDSVLAEVMKESGIAEEYKGKKILRVERKFGKNYLVISNTEEIKPI